MEPAPSRNLTAFTLIEVMFAAAIVLATFFSIYGVMTYGGVATRINRENLRATQIMLDKMEGLRLYKWAQITDTAVLVPTFTNWEFETNNIGMANAQGYGVQYTGLVSVVSPAPSMPAAYCSNMAKVTVTIGWNSTISKTPVPHLRTMSTFVSNKGVESYIQQ